MPEGVVDFGIPGVDPTPDAEVPAREQHVAIAEVEIPLLHVLEESEARIEEEERGGALHQRGPELTHAVARVVAAPEAAKLDPGIPFGPNRHRHTVPSVRSRWQSEDAKGNERANKPLQ